MSKHLKRVTIIFFLYIIIFFYIINSNIKTTPQTIEQPVAVEDKKLHYYIRRKNVTSLNQIKTFPQKRGNKVSPIL